MYRFHPAPSALAGPPPGTINPGDFKNALKRALDQQKIDFHKEFPDLGRLESPCVRKYNQALKAAEAEATACLDQDNPPAGSPLAEFNALTNAQLAQKCGSKTLDECVADVVKRQARFCAIEKAKDKSAAKTALRECCSELSAQKKQIDAALAFCLGN